MVLDDGRPQVLDTPGLNLCVVCLRWLTMSVCHCTSQKIRPDHLHSVSSLPWNKRGVGLFCGRSSLLWRSQRCQWDVTPRCSLMERDDSGEPRLQWAQSTTR